MQNNLQAVTTVALLTKRKKATTTFWNRLAQDKLTRTGQVNQHLPHLHYTPWKDLALVHLYAFSQLSIGTLLTKLDLVTNTSWQQWQICCLSRQQTSCFHQMCNQILPWFSFEVHLFSGAPCSLFSWMVPTPYIPKSVSLLRSGNLVKKLSIATSDPLNISHFSIKPRPTSKPCPNSISGKLVSLPQYGSAWRRYPSDEHKHQSLNSNCMGFPLINCFVPCLP